MSLFTLAAPVLAAAAASALAGPERFTLDNGATVILLPVKGAEYVGIESFYDVGFIDEPSGLTQAAHLLEHCACMGGTVSYAPGESFSHLGRVGMANAETLATFTHYDLMVPAPELEAALRIEAERLTSLRIDESLVRQEAPRCYAEAIAVESSQKAPLFKFAVMAAVQGWRHGAQTALIKGGLAEAPLQSLVEFHERTYAPANLMLILAGDFDVAEARLLVQRHIGAIPDRAPAPREPVDWNAVPARREITWDSTRAALVIAAPPPDDPRDRLALTLWGSVLADRLTVDAQLATVASFAACSAIVSPVGDMPFVLYATVAPGADPAEAERLLIERARALAADLQNDTALALIRQFARAFSVTSPLDAGAIAAQSRALAAHQNMEPAQATMMVLGNTALQAGIRAHVFGPDPAPLVAALDDLTPEQLRALTALDDLRVTLLRPGAP